MNRRRILIFSIVLGVLLLGGVVYQSGILSALNAGTEPDCLFKTNLEVAAGEDASRYMYKSDKTAELGTAENPFLVLEIVPQIGQAHFGYFIPGCEPVDISIVEANYTAWGQGAIGQVVECYTEEKRDLYCLYEEIPADTPYSVFYGNSWEAATENYKTRTELNGKYTDANPTWRGDDYNCWYQKPQSEECKRKGYFQKVAAGTGCFIAKEVYYYNFQTAQVGGKQYAFVYNESGDYNWVSSEETPGASSLEDKVWMERNDLFYCHAFGLKHNDKLIPAIFDHASSEEFKSGVVTMTPEILSAHMADRANKNMENLIDQADLIIIYTADNTGESIRKLWNEAGGEPKVDQIQTFQDHDLTNEETFAIMERMGSDEPAALVLEVNAMRAPGAEYNLSKLTYMALQYTPSYFCSQFLPKVKQDSYGQDKLWYDGKKAWDAYTFCSQDVMTGQWIEIPGATRHPAAVQDGYNIMDKILTYNGDGFDIHHILDPNYQITTTNNYNNYVKEWEEYRDEEGKPSTMLSALEFIVNTRRSYTPRLRILELEGCDEYIYGSAGWQDYYQALFPWYKPKSDEDNWLEDEKLIKITTMPTWEFIGSVGRYDYSATDENGNPKVLTSDSSDDLIAKYDLILIGAKQNAANGAEGYNQYTNGDAENSVDLGNLIYTSIGGTYSKGAVTEIRDAQYTEVLDMRHTGNDITLKRLLELEDFLRAGKPIVADSGLYSANTVDSGKVDKSSKLYDLLTWTGSGSENLFVYGSIENNKMRKLLSQNVCRLEFYTDGYPYEYSYTTTDQTISVAGRTITAGGVIDREISRADYDEAGNIVLEFHFYIQGNSGDRYNVYLNLDQNGDGVYSGSLKEHSEVDNMNAALGLTGSSAYEYDRSEQMLGLMIYDGSNQYLGDTKPADPDSSYALSANTEYYARYKLPASRQGMIPWKLEVQSRSNAKQRSSAIDYTVVKSQAEKEKIRVLQMNPQMDMSNGLDETNWSNAFNAFTKNSILVKSGETYEEFDSRNTDGDPEFSTRLYDKLNDNQRLTAEKFAAYIDPVQEFDVDIQFLFNDDWYQLFEKDKDPLTALEEWKDFLADYDMLVFGFRDTALFSGDSVFVEGVKDFVAQGKSMIISHDTVSSTRNVGDRYGDYSSWLRSISGQRRSYYNRLGSGIYEKSYNEVQVNGKTLSFTSAANLADENLKKYFHLLTADIDGDSVDSRFWGSSVNDWLDNENFIQICAQRQFDLNTLGVTERVTKDGIINTGGRGGNYETTFVKLTNNGQITSYPYQLNDVIEVLSTHTQNYQLDMEFLEQGDVNVWFTLSDMNDSEVADYISAVGSAGCNPAVNLYSAKDQDCRNSFYIYNTGNITYTGSGHGIANGYGQESQLMTDDEVKLFVNTMISAYRQPESRPYTEIDNADAEASDGTAVMYLDYDQHVNADVHSQEGQSNPNLPQPLSAQPAESGGLDNRIVQDGAGKSWVRIEFSVYDLRQQSEATDKKCYISLMHDGLTVRSDEVMIKKLILDANGVVTAESPVAALGTVTDPCYEVEASESGVNYAMYVPYDDVTDGEGIAKYTIGAYATYTKSNRFVTTTTTNTKAQLMLFPLFYLN